MKRTALVIAFLLIAGAAGAESYYCVPAGYDGKYVCEPAGEIREYPNGKTTSFSVNGFVDQFRCRKDDKGNWVCVPFEKGAILLEPVHSCPESNCISGGGQWILN